MLIRVDGRHDGVKQYLEHGQKEGRELLRDELDERVVLAGDLDITDSIIQAINVDPAVDRYLCITLSFREDEVNRETLAAIVREFEAFALAAYRPDEYSFYAEAHLPRLKSYLDKATGLLVERKPHIHIVIPKLNLISGQQMEPLGFVKSNIRFIDAFQEHINAKYGLASPKDHRRVELTAASEMISRYKGDLFGQASRELKETLLNAVLDGHIERYDDFMALLAGKGETRMRNAGRENEYPNVKLPGDAKGINLKEHVFSRAFIELPTADKLLQLSADVAATYDVAGKPREVSADIQTALDEWHETRVREVKYLNSGNARQYRAYQDASPEDRQLMLEELERSFYSRHLKEHHEQRTGSATEAGPRTGTGTERGHTGRRPGHDEFGQHLERVGRVYEFGRYPVPGAGRHRFGPVFGPTSGRGDERTNGRADGGRGHPFTPGRGEPAADRWQYGARATAARAPAASVNGVSDLSGRHVDRLPDRPPVLLPDHAPAQLDREQPLRADRVRRHSHRGRDSEPRAVKPTGRVADSALSQAVRDAHERRAVASAQASPEFAQIRINLDAGRLLAELSHSHGVRPEKYRVVKALEGGDRIRCGGRHLNVSDFLTKELYLPWRDAAPILRQIYQRQLDRSPAPPVKELPRAVLWQEYAAARDTQRQARREAWEQQRAGETVRRDAIGRAFLDARAAARANTDLRPSGRRVAISLARMTKVTGETALRETIKVERDALKARYGDAAGQSFAAWLQERAQGGDERALTELRRVHGVPEDRPSTPDTTDNHILPVLDAASASAPSTVQANQILYRQPTPRYTLSYVVHRNGEVTYRHDGRDVVRDRVSSVQVFARKNAIDRDALEAGLRLAQTRFGRTLELAGPEAFQVEAARVAADAGIYVEFTDDRLNELMQQRRAELINQRADRVLSRGAMPVSLPASPAAPAPPTLSTPAAAPDVDPDPAAPQPKGPTR